MTILRERKAWRRPRADRPSEKLTAEEQANVRAAMRFLRVRAGSWRLLAQAMGLTFDRISRCNKKKRPASAAIAFRAAQFAGVPVEEIVSGRWPTVGMCPMCWKP